MKKAILLSLLAMFAAPAGAAQEAEQKKFVSRIQLKDRDRDNLPWGSNCLTKLPPDPTPDCQGNVGCGDSAGCNFEGPGNDNFFAGPKAGAAIKQGSGNLILGDFAGSTNMSNVLAIGNSTTQQAMMMGLYNGGTGVEANIVVCEVPPSNRMYAATFDNQILDQPVLNAMKRNSETVARVVFAAMEQDKELREMFRKIMAIEDAKPKQ